MSADVAGVLAASRADGDGRTVLVRQAVGAHPGLVVHQRVQRDAVPPRDLLVVEVVRAGDLDRARAELRVRMLLGDDRDLAAMRLDRKSAVKGKSVSVRVDLGGRRILNHTN